MPSDSSVTTKLSREELYERVWTLPSTKLAKEFGISDAGLAKVCKRYNVPKPPPLGHWAKIQHGKPVERTPLPEEPDEWKRKVEIRGHIKESEEGFDAAIKASLVVARQRPTLLVAALPSSPLPIVARTMKSLRSAKVDDHGLVCPRAGNTLDVRVAPENIEIDPDCAGARLSL